MSTRDSTRFYAELEKRYPEQTRRNEGRHAWWRIGGLADCYFEPRTIDQLREVISGLAASTIPYCVIGCGTNILFDDAGFRGCIIKIGANLARITFAADRVTVEAGTWVPFFTLAYARRGFGGLEHLIGIPASIGGLVCMNGGSQRKNIGEKIHAVTALSADGTLHRYARAECDFGYRHSRFQASGEIVLSAEITADTVTDYAKARPEMLKILKDRRLKFPRKLPSCGSVFKSNPAMYAQYGPPGKVIENLGFKGRHEGGVMVSDLHANFILNHNGGSSKDILKLVGDIRQKTKSELGLDLEPEFIHLSPEGRKT